MSREVPFYDLGILRAMTGFWTPATTLTTLKTPDDVGVLSLAVKAIDSFSKMLQRKSLFGATRS
jgi:hypothetical protein